MFDTLFLLYALVTWPAIEHPVQVNLSCSVSLTWSCNIAWPQHGTPLILLLLSIKIKGDNHRSYKAMHSTVS